MTEYHKEDKLGQTLLVAHILPRCNVLGPNSRFVVWVQGCPFSCAGCVASSMKSFAGGQCVELEVLAEEILGTEGIEGITISGGEPFAQAGELAFLLGRVQQEKDMGVIVYTGFLYEQLTVLAEGHKEIADFLSRIDLLVDGPYQEGENLDYGLKGSANQRVIPLTSRYQEYLFLYNDPGSKRKIEFHPIPGGTFAAGIPTKEQGDAWKENPFDNRHPF